jgi:hypothetical protein
MSSRRAGTFFLEGGIQSGCALWLDVFFLHACWKRVIGLGIADGRILKSLLVDFIIFSTRKLNTWSKDTKMKQVLTRMRGWGRFLCPLIDLNSLRQRIQKHENILPPQRSSATHPADHFEGVAS